MFQDIPLVILVLLGGTAVLGHFGLLVTARWLNPVFLVCAAYLIIAPVSVALEIPGIEMLKWGRVYLSLLMLAMYVLNYRTLRFGPASWAFMVFLGFYSLGGIWSDNPVAAIQFKGMYAIVVLAGLLMASSIRDFADFGRSLRVLAAGAAVYGLIVLAGIATDPGQIFSGRLAVWGWNPNRIGHDCAAMLVLSLFIGLYDKAKIWKLFAFGMAGYFGFVTLASGSRAAVGMAAISGVILIAPLFRRPVLLTTLAVVGGLVVNFLLKSIDSATTERFTEVDFSNRQDLWRIGLELFAENPLAGSGWIYDMSTRSGGATRNLHSIYVQILAETGLIGAALFVICLLVCGIRSLGLLGALRRFPTATPYSFFAFSLAGATLAHGVAESSSLQGTNLNGLFLPFAIGLLDRIPQMIKESTNASAADADAQSQWEDEQAGEYTSYGEDPQPA